MIIYVYLCFIKGNDSSSRLRKAGVSSFGPFSLFLFSQFLPVSLTLSPYVVLRISQMHRMGSGVK